jgi:hypothetical protein
MITALVPVADVDDVGRYLYEHVIPTLDSEKAARFTAVADALVALGNDTDAIVTSKRVETLISPLAGAGVE